MFYLALFAQSSWHNWPDSSLVHEFSCYLPFWFQNVSFLLSITLQICFFFGLPLEFFCQPKSISDERMFSIFFHFCTQPIDKSRANHFATPFTIFHSLHCTWCWLLIFILFNKYWGCIYSHRRSSIGINILIHDYWRKTMRDWSVSACVRVWVSQMNQILKQIYKINNKFNMLSIRTVNYHIEYIEQWDYDFRLMILRSKLRFE